MSELDLNLLIDFYELTMANAYLSSEYKDTIAYFDMFYRKNPNNGGYVVLAGLEPLIKYLQNLKFSEEDIAFLKSKNLFSTEFLDYLKNFRFTCSIYSMPEGTIVFPNEPLLIVKGPIIQCQLIETMILLTINHQSLIATKAHRISYSAKGRKVIEMGSRRAQGYSAALYGARSAYIGGIDFTACTLADKAFNVPSTGTMAHSFVQLFDTEYEAFKFWAEVYPDNCSLLIDTYDVIHSGIINAIKVFDEVLKPLGKFPVSIRIDSGDITYLSKICRKKLDEAGYTMCKIVVSNSLDEYIIENILAEGAKIDCFGVGENLITSKQSPILGGVYKLVAIEKDKKCIPKIKISENTEKITTPGVKKLYRFYDKNTNKALADLLTLETEKPSENQYELFNPTYPWKRKLISSYYLKELLTPIFIDGKLVYNLPSLSEIRTHCVNETNSFWNEILRIDNPHIYYVDLSYDLWSLKQNLIYKK
ncbi:MAG: nicotinate phosphoribosyltransferase [Clostridium sp.]|nr:nicotinate phosphoribosyltransferase [Clostridium sp.]